jgi:hypothetical protein
MGIGTIMIFKIMEKDNIECYKVSTNDFEGVDFYMCIDKKQKLIKFYLTENFFVDPIRIIDYNKDEPIGSIPRVSTMVFSTAIFQAIKTFNLSSSRLT